MNFHFKKALEEAKEEVKYLQTFEGYAETVLRSSIEELKTLCFHNIDVISFAVIQTEYPFSPKIFVFIREQGYKTVKEIYKSDFYLTLEGILSVFEIIKKHLHNEGFNCKDIKHLDAPCYRNNIKRFYISL